MAVDGRRVGFGPIPLRTAVEAVTGLSLRRCPFLPSVTPLDVNDIDIENDVLIRQSTMNSMQLCPARVGFELHKPEGYVDPFGEALVYGTAVHYLCEQHVLDPSRQRELIMPSVFNAWFKEEILTQYNATMGDIPSAEYKTFRRKVIEAYRMWVLQVYEHAVMPDSKDKTLYVEQGLYVLLGEHEGRRIIAHGTPDLTIKGLRIEDNKTTNAAFKWTQDKADTEIQPTLYLAMHNITHDDHVEDFVYRIYNRKAEDWNSLYTSRSFEAQEAMLRSAYEYGRQIVASVFPPTPVAETRGGKRQRGWYCSPSWCSAWNVCDYKKLVDDDADWEQVVVKSWR